jgi:hypothetical protein
MIENAYEFELQGYFSEFRKLMGKRARLGDAPAKQFIKLSRVDQEAMMRANRCLYIASNGYGNHFTGLDGATLEKRMWENLVYMHREWNAMTHGYSAWFPEDLETVEDIMKMRLSEQISIDDLVIPKTRNLCIGLPPGLKINETGVNSAFVSFMTYEDFEEVFRVHNKRVRRYMSGVAMDIVRAAKSFMGNDFNWTKAMVVPSDIPIMLLMVLETTEGRLIKVMSTGAIEFLATGSREEWTELFGEEGCKLLDGSEWPQFCSFLMKSMALASARPDVLKPGIPKGMAPKSLIDRLERTKREIHRLAIPVKAKRRNKGSVTESSVKNPYKVDGYIRILWDERFERDENGAPKVCVTLPYWVLPGAQDVRTLVNPKLESLDLNDIPRKRGSSKMSWVYFLLNSENSTVKIGWSEDPEFRAKSLQTGNHAELTLLGKIPGGRNREKSLHRRLREYHVNLEWFKYEGVVPGLISNLLNGSRVLAESVDAQEFN